MAACTLAGLNGTERSRTPTASNTAFAIAEGTTAVAGSPTPHGFSVGRSISSMSTSGISENVKMGYLAQSRLVTADRSKVTSSLSVQLTALAVHLNRGNSADIGASELVLHVGDAPAGGNVAALALRRRMAFPPGEACQPLQELDTARIVKVTQPELERVGAGGGGKFIHERLVGESVLHASRGAKPCRTEGRLGQPVRHGPHVGEGVGYRRVLDDVPRTHRGLVRQARQFGRDQFDVPRSALGDEELGVPRDHVAVRVEPGLEVDKRRWPLGVPAMLVGAHPLHAHRPLYGAGEQRGVGGGILMAVATVAARAFDVHRAHVTLRYREHGRELFAQVMRGLAGRPTGELAVLDFHHGARWPDRAVRVNRKVIGGAEPFGGLLQRLHSVPHVAGDVVL